MHGGLTEQTWPSGQKIPTWQHRNFFEAYQLWLRWSEFICWQASSSMCAAHHPFLPFLWSEMSLTVFHGKNQLFVVFHLWELLLADLADSGSPAACAFTFWSQNPPHLNNLGNLFVVIKGEKKINEKIIARGTMDPGYWGNRWHSIKGYWVHNLSKSFS